MKRLYIGLGIAAFFVAAAIVVDAVTAGEFQVLSIAADAVTVLGIVALAIEFGIYVTERRPRARARQAVIALADDNPGKWAAAEEELLELGGHALDALAPVLRLRGGTQAYVLQYARRRAGRAVERIARSAKRVSDGTKAVRILGQAVTKSPREGCLQRILFRASAVPSEVAVQAAVELCVTAPAFPDVIGNVFNQYIGKLAGVSALLALSVLSEKCDVTEEVRKASDYDDEDVQQLSEFILHEDAESSTPETILEAARSGELQLSREGLRYVRMMVAAIDKAK